MFEITMNGGSFGSRVTYKGEDISNHIRQITVNHEAGELPTAEITLIAPKVTITVLEDQTKVSIEV